MKWLTRTRTGRVEKSKTSQEDSWLKGTKYLNGRQKAHTHCIAAVAADTRGKGLGKTNVRSLLVSCRNSSSSKLASDHQFKQVFTLQNLARIQPAMLAERERVVEKHLLPHLHYLHRIQSNSLESSN